MAVLFTVLVLCSLWLVLLSVLHTDVSASCQPFGPCHFTSLDRPTLTNRGGHP